MKRVTRRYYKFIMNTTLNYMLLKNWVKIILFPLWCLLILTSSVAMTLILWLYYVPKYRTKAYERMVIDSLNNTFKSCTDEKEAI